MNRRSALRYLGVASAAALALPSCVSDPKKASIALNNLKVSADEEELLAAFATALIPPTDTPGAKEVDAHLYTFIMVDDCMSPEDQKKFLNGMRRFNDEVKKLTGKSFMEAVPGERSLVLQQVFDRREELSEDVAAFVSMSRRFIIEGYTTSQHFLTKVREYKLVPGPVFKGCTPLDQTTVS